MECPAMNFKNNSDLLNNNTNYALSNRAVFPWLSTSTSSDQQNLTYGNLHTFELTGYMGTITIQHYLLNNYYAINNATQFNAHSFSFDIYKISE